MSSYPTFATLWSGAIEPTIYATEGIERTVYTSALCDTETGPAPRIDLSCGIGARLSEGYRLTAVSGNDSVGAADWPLTVTLSRDGATQATLSSGIKVTRTTRTARTIKCLFIGDSLTAAAVYLDQISARAAADTNTAVTFLGTQTTVVNATTYHHEGRGGWTEAMYSGFPTDANSSPFYFSGAFNFATYRSTNSIAAPDYVGIELGINDIFNTADSTTDAQLTSDVNSSFARIDAWITSIRADTPGCIIGIHTITPPALSQDAFGLGLASCKNRLAYLRRRQIYYKAQIAYFSGRTANGVYVIPTGSAVDMLNGAQTTSAAAFANGPTITRLSDHVHPSTAGYKQYGDAVFAALKGIFAP